MNGKTVLITGCSAGGIGHALAEQFQKRGLTVFATARKLSKMSSLEKLPNVHLLSLDVTSASGIAATVEEVKSRTGGKLDYLVNNAGQSLHMPTLDMDIEAGKKLFETNFWGPFQMIQAFAPLLIEAKGTIVNIGSIVAYAYGPFSSGSLFMSCIEIHQLTPVQVSTMLLRVPSISLTRHCASILPRCRSRF